jgi:transposase
LKYIRSLSNEKLYIIQDNFSPHIKEEVTTWCESNDIEIVLTPTNASWLNRIEGHFSVVKKFAIKNSNYKDHKELASAIRRYLIWRNKNANDKKLIDIENKVNFS